jgi:tripartite-type tricarboxylate transporter receptor subunit TctC
VTRATAAVLTIPVLAVLTTAVSAQPVDGFFKGRPINLYIGFAPGGTYDYFGRAVGRFIGKHIPGNPIIVVQTMQGAGSLQAANFLYAQAPKDGTAWGVVTQTLPLEEALRSPGAHYKAAEFTWIGRMTSILEVHFTWKTSKGKTIEDARAHEIPVAGTGTGSPSEGYPKLLNALAGTKFKIITGYRGAADVDLAIERNEADARVSSWTAVKTTRGSWLNEGRIVVPFQTGLKRHPEMPNLPLASELALNDEGRRILEFMNSDSSIGWNVIAPPGVPADRVAVLRRAFDATMADPNFLADAQKRGFEIIAARGEDVQEVVNRTIATPPEAVARLRAIMGGMK